MYWFFYLMKRLQKFHRHTRRSFRRKFCEAMLAECGKGLMMNDNVLISHPQNVHIGNRVTLNDGVTLDGKGEIFIGDGCAISFNAVILTGNLTIENGLSDLKHTRTTVRLGNNVWIGAGAIVLPGVTIHDNVIVGAGSVVTKDLASLGVYAGNPAKLIRNVSL